MKKMRVIIDIKYNDGRRDDHFHAEGIQTEDFASFCTEKLSSYIRYKHINFETGDVQLANGEVMQPGIPYIDDKSFCVITVTFFMEDDGNPCDKNHLYINAKCVNSETGNKETKMLDYVEGLTTTFKAYPYVVTIKEIHGEEAVVDIDDGKKKTTHLVQLYNPADRNDEYSYATGNPNDPVDSAGPSLYLKIQTK